MDVSTIAFIAYFSCMILLVLILSIHAYRISEWKSKRSFINAVFSMRSIYGTALVQLYDTSTDVAILIFWGILTHQEVSGEKDHENVNMLSFLVPSIFLIFMYRIAYAIFYHVIFSTSGLYSRSDILLILCDLYVFQLVYEQFTGQYMSPCLMQQMLQLLESVFESMPQLVMQSIFLVRTFNTELAEDAHGSIYIVFASIIASLMSIVSKFSRLDRWFTSPLQSLSISYLFVIIWRFCESIARFSIFTLLWAVVGGIYLPMYLLISFAIYFCLEKWTDLVWIAPNKVNLQRQKRQMSIRIRMLFIYIAQSVVGIPLRRHIKMNIIRFVDNCIILGIICSFAFLKFDCILCYDKSDRNALYNPYILILIQMAGVAIILGFIIYLGLYYTEIVVTERTRILGVQFVGLENIKQEDRKKVMRGSVHPKLLKLILSTIEPEPAVDSEKDETHESRSHAVLIN
eukprot:129971_1